VLPLLATREGLRLQLQTGIRSHRRRFGWDGGFWLPECAYAPGLEWRLAEHGVRWFCVDQSAHQGALEALTPIATEAGPVALSIDWEAVSWLWSLDGYPSDPAHAQFAGKSLRGIRIWKVGGGAYEPGAAVAAARRQAREFLSAMAARLREFAAAEGRRGLAVFAIDTELLGHWWSEGVLWLREVLAGAAGAGVRLLSVPRALAEHEPVRRPLAASSWGEGKDLRTWDSPKVGDIAWAGRRLELRLLRALAGGLPREAAARAARELLAVQSSDWAFLDGRGEAGDYAFMRASGHAESALQAIDSPASTEPRMRSLAPDLSLAPLLEP
jgi:1,4-alpha-glucan branching enzyme